MTGVNQKCQASFVLYSTSMQFYSYLLVFVICFLHELDIRNCESSGSDSNVDNGGEGNGNLEDGNSDNGNLEDGNNGSSGESEANRQSAEVVKSNAKTSGEAPDEANDSTLKSGEEAAEEPVSNGIDEKRSGESAEGGKVEKNKRSKLKPAIAAQYEAEKLRGSPADMFGTNQHYYYPTEYKDFGRRFVLQYPYKEKRLLRESVAEAVLDNDVKETKKQAYGSPDAKLIPVKAVLRLQHQCGHQRARFHVRQESTNFKSLGHWLSSLRRKASPELVISVAMQSMLEEASKPQKKHVDNSKILRSGQYWNSVWKEEVNPESILRSYKEKTSSRLAEKQHNHAANLSSLRAKVMPGSKLYELVSVLKQYSPRLLYVINNQNKK